MELHKNRILQMKEHYTKVAFEYFRFNQIVPREVNDILDLIEHIEETSKK